MSIQRPINTDFSKINIDFKNKINNEDKSQVFVKIKTNTKVLVVLVKSKNQKIIILTNSFICGVNCKTILINCHYTEV